MKHIAQFVIMHQDYVVIKRSKGNSRKGSVQRKPIMMPISKRHREERRRREEEEEEEEEEKKKKQKKERKKNMVSVEERYNMD